MYNQLSACVSDTTRLAPIAFERSYRVLYWTFDAMTGNTHGPFTSDWNCRTSQRPSPHALKAWMETKELVLNDENLMLERVAIVSNNTTKEYNANDLQITWSA